MGDITHYFDDSLKVVTEYNETLTSVRITDFQTGVRATGHAKRHPEDDYSLEVGQKLAYIRAYQRYLVKLHKKAIKRIQTIERDFRDDPMEAVHVYTLSHTPRDLEWVGR